MQIDWLTVAAQIVNFLVLVWLLQRFLYGPITRAMERREQRIAQRLHETDQKREEAEGEVRAYRKKQEEFDERRESMLAEARDEAEEERKALQQAAREEVGQRKRKWLKQVENQQAEFLRDIRQRSTEHFYALARRALSELADVQLEEQIAHIFTGKLEALDKDTRRKIAAEGRKAANLVTVRSRFEMSPKEKHHITKAIHDQILDGAEVAYEQSPENSCGLELKAGGQTVSWSLDSYFDSLESQIGRELGALPPSSG